MRLLFTILLMCSWEYDTNFFAVRMQVHNRCATIFHDSQDFGLVVYRPNGYWGWTKKYGKRNV